jgi:Mn-dependent DtxR family transcriptional regulator
MHSPSEMRKNKETFLREMYSLADGRFGVLIDSYDLADKFKFDWETLETIIGFLEAKGLIASYEGTFYASLTLKGVEYVENTE